VLSQPSVREAQSRVASHSKSSKSDQRLANRYTGLLIKHQTLALDSAKLQNNAREAKGEERVNPMIMTSHS
jgi:hypothetical protein